MKKLLLATGNPGKIADLKGLVNDLAVELVSLKDVNVAADCIEDGATLEENAKTKAVYYRDKTGLATIADDTGLEIDALNGAPGVRSKRWKGTDMTDSELVEYTLEQMQSVPEGKRGAQLHCVLALALPGGEVYTADGILRAEILKKPYPRQDPGHAFRSILFLPQMNKAYVELTEEEEQTLDSHRKQALQKILPMLSAWING